MYQEGVVSIRKELGMMTKSKKRNIAAFLSVLLYTI